MNSLDQFSVIVMSAGLHRTSATSSEILVGRFNDGRGQSVLQSDLVAYQAKDHWRNFCPNGFRSRCDVILIIIFFTFLSLILNYEAKSRTLNCWYRQGPLYHVLKPHFYTQNLPNKENKGFH